MTTHDGLASLVEILLEETPAAVDGGEVTVGTERPPLWVDAQGWLFASLMTVTRDGVGIKIKGGWGSSRDLDGKAFVFTQISPYIMEDPRKDGWGAQTRGGVEPPTLRSRLRLRRLERLTGDRPRVRTACG